jgi:hypothetical protein
MDIPIASAFPPDAMAVPIAALVARCMAASWLFKGFENAGTSLSKASTPAPTPADIAAVKPPLRRASMGSLPEIKADVPEDMAPATADPATLPIALAMPGSSPLAADETEFATDPAMADPA